MATTRTLSNWAHEGYMDGLEGKDPNADLTGSWDYDTAWLIGCQDREAGVKPSDFGYGSETPNLAGREIAIPKGTIIKTIGKEPKPAGRTYKVKVHHMISATTAWFGNHHWGKDEENFVRPQSAKVCWPGTGGYWTEADIADVVVG